MSALSEGWLADRGAADGARRYIHFNLFDEFLQVGTSTFDVQVTDNGDPARSSAVKTYTITVEPTADSLYVVYQDAITQADEAFAEAIAPASAERDAAHDAAEAAYDAAAEQAGNAYRSAMAAADSVYDAALAIAQADYDAAVAVAEAALEAARAAADSAWTDAAEAADTAWHAAYADAETAYVNALAAAETTYQQTLLPYQEARDAALLYANEHPEDPEAQAALAAAEQALAHATTQAAAVRDQAGADALAARTAAENAAENAWESAMEVAWWAWEDAIGVAEWDYEVAMSPAEEAYQAAEDAAVAAYTAAEEAAQLAFETALADAAALRQSAQDTADAVFALAYDPALAAWHASEESAWNDYVAALANLPDSPSPAERIVEPFSLPAPCEDPEETPEEPEESPPQSADKYFIEEVLLPQFVGTTSQQRAHWLEIRPDNVIQPLANLLGEMVQSLPESLQDLAASLASELQAEIQARQQLQQDPRLWREYLRDHRRAEHEQGLRDLLRPDLHRAIASQINERLSTYSSVPTTWDWNVLSRADYVQRNMTILALAFVELSSANRTRYLGMLGVEEVHGYLDTVKTLLAMQSGALRNVNLHYGMYGADLSVRRALTTLEEALEGEAERRRYQSDWEYRQQVDFNNILNSINSNPQTRTEAQFDQAVAQYRTRWENETRGGQLTMQLEARLRSYASLNEQLNTAYTQLAAATPENREAIQGQINDLSQRLLQVTQLQRMVNELKSEFVATQRRIFDEAIAPVEQRERRTLSTAERQRLAPWLYGTEPNRWFTPRVIFDDNETPMVIWQPTQDLKDLQKSQGRYLGAEYHIGRPDSVSMVYRNHLYPVTPAEAMTWFALHGDVSPEAASGFMRTDPGYSLYLEWSRRYDEAQAIRRRLDDLPAITPQTPQPMREAIERQIRYYTPRLVQANNAEAQAWGRYTAAWRARFPYDPVRFTRPTPDSGGHMHSVFVTDAITAISLPYGFASFSFRSLAGVTWRAFVSRSGGALSNRAFGLAINRATFNVASNAAFSAAAHALDTTLRPQLGNWAPWASMAISLVTVVGAHQAWVNRAAIFGAVQNGAHNVFANGARIFQALPFLGASR